MLELMELGRANRECYCALVSQCAAAEKKKTCFTSLILEGSVISIHCKFVFSVGKHVNSQCESDGII